MAAQKVASEPPAGMVPDGTQVGLHESDKNTVADEVDIDYLMDVRPSLRGVGAEIAELFVTVLKLPSMLSLNERAERFIDEMHEFAPKEHPYYDMGPKDFAWEFGEWVMDIATRIPPRSSAQDLLVEVIALLSAIQKTEEIEEAQTWKNLSSLGMSASEAWDQCPQTNPSFEDIETFTESQWLNLNSFFARLYGQRVADWFKFAISELRLGLETPLFPEINDQPSADTRLRVACEWMFQSAPRLLCDSVSLKTSEDSKDPGRARAFREGPLFSDPGPSSVERWCFWRRRFVELQKEVSGDLVEKLNEAAGRMDQAEKDVADRVVRAESENRKDREDSNGSSTTQETLTQPDGRVEDEKSMEQEDSNDRKTSPSRHTSE